jgi:hypothetical protein
MQGRIVKFTTVPGNKPACGPLEEIHRCGKVSNKFLFSFYPNEKNQNKSHDKTCNNCFLPNAFPGRCRAAAAQKGKKASGQASIKSLRF